MPVKQVVGASLGICTYPAFSGSIPLGEYFHGLNTYLLWTIQQMKRSPNNLVYHYVGTRGGFVCYEICEVR